LIHRHNQHELVQTSKKIFSAAVDVFLLSGTIFHFNVFLLWRSTLVITSQRRWNNRCLFLQRYSVQNRSYREGMELGLDNYSK